jgi:hypothetical protein
LAVKCAGTKRDGSPCTAAVERPQRFCWWHDPANADKRRRAASKAGKAKPSRELAAIKQRLSGLADDVLAGAVDRGDAAVVGQILNTYLRALSVELKVNEQRELIERLQRLEEAAERMSEGGSRRWGA